MKEWAQCPEELGPPPLLGKNKIINNENEALVEKYLTNRNTLKTEETQKFSKRGLQMGLMNRGELPQGNKELAWASRVNLGMLCAFDCTGQSDFYVSVKSDCPC